MARISISDLYLGEGAGEKYGGILNAVMQEFFTNGVPEGCDERTWIELLTVKHTFLVAERMKTEGDVVSELSEAASPFCASDKATALCSSAQSAPQFPPRLCSGAHCAPQNPAGSFAPPEPSEMRREVTE